MQSDLANLVLNLESSESLVVEDLASLPAIESEVSMAEVSEYNNACKEEHPWVVSLALLFEGIISQLVTIRLIVNLRVLLKGHGVCIAGEGMLMTKN